MKDRLHTYGRCGCDPAGFRFKILPLGSISEIGSTAPPSDIPSLTPTAVFKAR